MIELDDLDRALLSELQENAYRTHAELARKLDTSKTTVTRRIGRMLSNGVMEIVAVPDLKHVGLNISVLIGLKVDNERLDSIVEQLIVKSAVYYVVVVTGRYDVVIAVGFASITELTRFLKRDLSSIAGITNSETLVCLEVKKRIPGMCFELPASRPNPASG